MPSARNIHENFDNDQHTLVWPTDVAAEHRLLVGITYTRPRQGTGKGKNLTLRWEQKVCQGLYQE